MNAGLASTLSRLHPSTVAPLTKVWCKSYLARRQPRQLAWQRFDARQSDCLTMCVTVRRFDQRFQSVRNVLCLDLPHFEQT
jgi:hypothetical protein